MICSGYCESCYCVDCKEVSELHEDLKWYSRNKEDNKDIIKEIEDKIESMGYSI